jgi:TusA-related sulfurtransferase
MKLGSTPAKPAMRFESMNQADVPKGRDGKHKQIVTQLMNDLSQLEPGSALKIPLAELPDTKENIRSALSRATRQHGLDIATASDEEFLYVWKAEKNADPAAP